MCVRCDATPASPDAVNDAEVTASSAEGSFSEEQLKNGIKVEDIVTKLPAEERKRLCNSLFADGVYVNIPECWACVDDPPKVLAAVNAQSEPLSPDMLGALERIFPRLISQDGRMSAAVLLYRYRYPTGSAYLRKRVKERSDVEAARLLAFEKDLVLLPDLLRVLAKFHSSELALALSKWRHPKITAALLNEARLAGKTQEPGWLSHILAAANTGAPAAVSLLRTAFASLPAKSPSRLEAAAVLIKIQPEKSNDLIRYLLQQLASPDSNSPDYKESSSPGDSGPDLYRKYFVVEALGMSGHPRMVVPLEAVINDYLAKGDVTKYQSAVGASRSELAVCALEGLAGMKAKNVHSLAMKLLRKLEKSSNRGEYWARTAKIILQDGSKETRQFVEGIMGRQWLANESALRKLRAVDPNYLPRDEFDPSQRFEDPNRIPVRPQRVLEEKQ